MTARGAEAPRIEDHALIGDCRSAALVTRDGEIDWLCWPRFDSPALFAGLLDPRRGGAWCIRPADPEFDATRRYLPGSAVVETRFATPHGVVSLTDFMPVATADEKNRELWPEHQILRRVECHEGEVDMEVAFSPRPDFGRRAFELRDLGPSGVVLELGAAILAFRSDMGCSVARHEARARCRVRRGEIRWSSLSFARGTPAYLAPLGETAQRRLDQTLTWWRDWADRLVVEGPYGLALVRSAITLKLLTYAPTGAVIAAPTTSLPESIGGERNWDYRYCWLRDAAMTIRAFYALGCHEEGEAFASWILHATRLTQPEVRVLYDVYGNAPSPEHELHALEGYRASRPVRVGNGARDQVQLDVYGEVVEAVAAYARRGGVLDRASRRFLRGIGKTVARRWEEADHGIWEPRTEPRQHTYSRLRCWSALDALLEGNDEWKLGLPAAIMAVERDRIRAFIDEACWNPQLGSYVATAGGNALDASLLLLSEHGFIDDSNRERFRATVHSIEGELACGPRVFRYRSEDGLPPGEGAFGICSFWLVSALVRIGETDRARQHFEELLGYANDLGLYGEEFDESGAPLGNFPQAFTHVGLINAALALASRSAEAPR
jgi:GH15 family glucan-1,4-alpha-glucosidase